MAWTVDSEDRNARKCRKCRVFGVRAGGADNEVMIVAGCSSWAFRATMATYFGAFAIIFAAWRWSRESDLCWGRLP